MAKLPEVETEDVKKRKQELLTAAIEAEEQFAEDELESGAVVFRACPACGGDGDSLGLLGKRHHFRCRSCGIDFSKHVG